MANTLDKHTSDIIKASRFPLVFLVLLVHATSWTHTIDENLVVQEKIFKYTTDFFSFNLGSLAVPAFFFISGFLFFWSYNKENGTKDKRKWFLEKYKSRIMSLVVPYLIWNVLMVLAILIKNFIFQKIGVEPDEGILTLKSSNFIKLFWNPPVNYPTWYIRDLICMVIISPLTGFIIGKYKWGSLAVLGIIFMLPIRFGYAGFNWQSIMLFSLGAWFGINKIDFLQIFRRYKYISYFAATGLLLLATFLNGSEYHGYILRFVWFFGIPAMFNIVDTTISSQKVWKLLLRLSEYSFFTYVLHEIYIMGWTKGILLRVLGESMTAEYIRYFVFPFIVAAVCILIFETLKKVMPKALSISIGKR